MSLEADIARLHNTYVRLTRVAEKLAWCGERWKTLVLEYGYDTAKLEADLEHACRYLLRRISEGKRNEEALCSRLFLSLERFAETVALAKACAPKLAKGSSAPLAPASVPATWDSVDEAEAERLRDVGRKQIADLLKSLGQ